MSKPHNAFRSFPTIFAAVLLSFSFSQAQGIDATVTVVEPGILSTILVEGHFVEPMRRKSPRNLSFLQELAGKDGLAARIDDIKLTDAEGLDLPFKRLNPGEILADSGIGGWRYKVSSGIPFERNIAAHITWLSGTEGLLMLDDLLPQADSGGKRGRVTILVPEGWQVFGPVKPAEGNRFEVPDVEKAAFFIGKGLRSSAAKIPGADLRMIVSGQWLFSDAEAGDMAGEIAESYRKLFGSMPAESVSIFITKFPLTTSPGEWEADTRGTTVTILSSDMPFKTRSIQRLHEQLRHEIFHLWIPNGVALSGNYDWFYEGFTLYSSLKSGVLANRIRFSDFLDTLSRAYNIDNMQSPKISLLEASKNRWNGYNAQVYARGMLAAFLADVALLRASKGKNSVGDIFREIYIKHRGGPRADGNDAILSIMRGRRELLSVVDKYIVGNSSIDWNADLKHAGLESKEEGMTARLSVTPKPDGRQKEILERLGYNSWRKLSPGSR